MLNKTVLQAVTTIPFPSREYPVHIPACLCSAMSIKDWWRIVVDLPVDIEDPAVIALTNLFLEGKKPKSISYLLSTDKVTAFRFS